ncbi:PREDICTED: cysteine-rich DPF motif domain-containing protein 1-like [Branchiostoma belcheri]|uniref:Cysteine-rich DPF motif domain-containing protein 1 n=1 Tax=Branchiostoma belcheri TaxID=7741 RepID=A0A6P4YIV0_BRABE|nr:PREDICTED: cysteine-rich DPF motif domain-containing protein 1-like [Branchiostoma belcheri]
MADHEVRHKDRQQQDRQKQGDFVCSLCNVSAPFDYLGTTPPFAKSIVLLEMAFVMKDQFSQGKEGHLVLGANCCLCGKCVCLGQNCSLFYTKRFCLPCVLQNIQEFPLEIQDEVAKKKTWEMPKY